MMHIVQRCSILSEELIEPSFEIYTLEQSWSLAQSADVSMVYDFRNVVYMYDKCRTRNLSHLHDYSQRLTWSRLDVPRMIAFWNPAVEPIQVVWALLLYA